MSPPGASDVFVFIGPTLALADARQALDAVYLPPVRQGDLYRLVSLRQPRVVGIVDGYFNQVPAVWHKEILWALSCGVQVVGAASMGALRAAELTPFGMQGIGRIFEAYRDGVLPPYRDQPFEDDDEVAVSHGPGELGYLSLSESMVNMRCTLASAAAAGVIDADVRDFLVATAKQRFYPERNYEALFDEAQERGCASEVLARLRQWLPGGRRDQKREDALELLRWIGEGAAPTPGQHAKAYTFQHTAQWQAAIAEVQRDRPGSPGIVDELRLEGASYVQLRDQVQERLAGLAMLSETAGADLPTTDGLDGEPEATLEEVLLAHHGRPEVLDSLWRRERLSQELHATVRALPRALIEHHLLSELRQSDKYAQLQSRLSRKERVLAAQQSLPSADQLTGLQELQLQDWYFGQRLGQSIPGDLESYVEDLGFEDMHAFNRALLREFVFVDSER